MSRRSSLANSHDSPDRESLESSHSFPLSFEDHESQALFPSSYSHGRHISLFERFRLFLRARGLNISCLGLRTRTKTQRSKKTICQHCRPRRLCFLFQSLLVIAILLVTFIATVRPSYSKPPAHYHELRRRVEASSEAGRANPEKEKVFIVASLFDPDGHLAQGAWAKSVLSLIDLLGPTNVFLSIYENGAGSVAKTALQQFEKEIMSEHTIIFEDQPGLDAVPSIQLPDTTSRIRRIAYLAEVRNRALRPLDSLDIKYNKILYLNDVVFDPVNAVQLLFATNAGSGKAKYLATCSMDFINPFKFYDTFASRDLEGYSMGLPIYPWFSSAGNAQSRQDVFDQKDAVRVKSCWGGMVAFDAKFFQSTADELGGNVTGNTKGLEFTGLRFRSEQELFWESSECCLIHADIQNLVPDDDAGIYMNPYIRVSYDTTTLFWLGLSRRLERTYAPFQYMINKIVGLPYYNPRRAAQAGQKVQEEVWSPDTTLPAGGSFKLIDRTASHDGFCGVRALQVLKEGDRQPGEKNWEFVPVPTS